MLDYGVALLDYGVALLDYGAAVTVSDSGRVIPLSRPNALQCLEIKMEGKTSM